MTAGEIQMEKQVALTPKTLITRVFSFCSLMQLRVAGRGEWRSGGQTQRNRRRTFHKLFSDCKISGVNFFCCIRPTLLQLGLTGSNCYRSCNCIHPLPTIFTFCPIYQNHAELRATKQHRCVHSEHIHGSRPLAVNVYWPLHIRLRQATAASDMSAAAESSASYGDRGESTACNLSLVSAAVCLWTLSVIDYWTVG